MTKKRTFSISVDKEAIAAVDKLVARGRFGSRSQAIEYCIKQVIDVERKGERYIDFLVEFLELIEDRPDVNERLREFLKTNRREGTEKKKSDREG